jgi:hypothetical protein
MKKIAKFLPILALAAMLLASCSKNTPKEAADKWLTAFNHLDLETAKSVSTDDTKRLLSQLEQLTKGVTDSNKRDLKKIIVTIKNVKVDSSTAVATYVTSDNPGRDQTLNLVNQNGKWLVAFSKVDLMGVPRSATEEAEGDNAVQSADSLSNSSMDTTKNANQ